MRSTLIFLIWILLSSCSSTTTLTSSTLFKDECIVVAHGPERVTSISIGSTRLHDITSPIMHGSVEEQFLSRQLYETLTWVDCTNTVRKGLASSWKSSDNDKEWTIFIRPEARFWNGASITSDEIASQWADLPKSNPQIDSMLSVSTRELRILLNKSNPNFPRLLADPKYSVYRSVPEIDWHIGSGPFRVESTGVSRSFGGADGVTKIIRTTSDSDPARPLSLVFHSSEGADARDLISKELDLVITTDPSASKYASESGQYTDFPLPWDRSYVIAWGFEAGNTGRQNPSEFSHKFTESFLNNFAPIDARSGTIPEWVPGFNACSSSSGSTAGALRDSRGAPDDHTSANPLRRIVYEEHDLVAEALAGRLSALSSSSPADINAAEELRKRLPGWNEEEGMIPAVPLAPNIFSESLKNRSDLYYVLSLPRRVLDPCTISTRSYSTRGPATTLSTNDNIRFLPLVDTRRHLFVSPAVSGLSLDWFGNLRFVP